MTEAILTESTCGDACWYARETVCRCSCGGRNHGCLKVEGEGTERPPRTKRAGARRFELVGVVDGWLEAQREAKRLQSDEIDRRIAEIAKIREARYGINPDDDKRRDHAIARLRVRKGMVASQDWALPGDCVVQKAGKSQKNWKEVKSSGFDRPMLIWKML